MTKDKLSLRFLLELKSLLNLLALHVSQIQNQEMMNLSRPRNVFATSGLAGSSRERLAQSRSVSLSLLLSFVNQLINWLKTSNWLYCPGTQAPLLLLPLLRCCRRNESLLTCYLRPDSIQFR